MKLSDTQLVVLSAACQREDRNVLPLPANLKGGAAQKVMSGLLAKGLVEEAVAGPGNPVWRTGEAGRKVTLLATDAAFQALGIEGEPASKCGRRRRRGQRCKAQARAEGWRRQAAGRQDVEGQARQR